MAKLSTLCEGVRIEARFGAAPENHDFRDSDGWLVTLRYRKRQMTVPFYMGMGHGGKEPTAVDVLACLCSDAMSVKYANGFEDWCGDLGYDADSRKAERIYKACESIAKRLRRFLGNDFDNFCEAARDE